MNEAEAKAHVALILGDVATQLTPADYTHVLARSVTFDPAGLKPGEPGYVTTYDGDWAAAEAATLLAVRGMASGGIVRFTSEGATFEKRSPDLFGLARMLRAEDVAAAVVTVLKQPPSMRTLIWSMRSIHESD